MKEGRVTVSVDHALFGLQQVTKLMRAARLNLSSSVTHTVRLKDVNDGPDLLESGKEHVERVMIEL